MFLIFEGIEQEHHESMNKEMATESALCPCHLRPPLASSHLLCKVWILWVPLEDRKTSVDFDQKGTSHTQTMETKAPTEKRIQEHRELQESWADEMNLSSTSAAGLGMNRYSSNFQRLTPTARARSKFLLL